MSIHPTAIVSDKARLAADVVVGPYCVIGDDVEIGSGSVIAAHVVIDGPTVIGRDNRFYAFSSIGNDPQDKKFAGEKTRLVIGDRNTIREYCTLSRGTVQDAGETRIGSDNWIMAYVHVAHDCIIGDNCILANNATLAGHVRLGDWVILGGFTGIHQFCRVGAHAFLGMFSVVNQDVPAYVTVFGHPAAPKGINSEGLKRRGFTAEQVRNIKNGYRVVFRQGRKLAEAIEELARLEPAQPELGALLESLRSSERGVAR